MFGREFFSAWPARYLPSSWPLNTEPPLTVWPVITLPLLAPQGKEKVNVLVRYRARIGWEVNAPHEFRDTTLGIVVDARSFCFPFLIWHGCLL